MVKRKLSWKKAKPITIKQWDCFTPEQVVEERRSLGVLLDEIADEAVGDIEYLVSENELTHDGRDLLLKNLKKLRCLARELRKG